MSLTSSDYWREYSVSGTTMLEHPFKSVSFKSFEWHDIASVLCFSSLSFQKAVEKTSLHVCLLACLLDRLFACLLVCDCLCASFQKEGV